MAIALAAAAIAVAALVLALRPGDADLREGLAPAFAEALSTCEPLSGRERDTCAFTVVSASAVPLGLGPGEVLELCARLQDDYAHGWCIERANSLGNQPSLEYCDQIREPRAEASCRLLATDFMLVDARLDRVVGLCDALTDLREHCFAHLVERREQQWLRRGQQGLMTDLDLMLQQVPEVHAYRRVGHNIGEIASRLGWSPGMAGPCQLFAAGEGARKGCEAAMRTPMGHMGAAPPAGRPR